MRHTAAALAAIVAAAALALAGCGNPKDAEGWAKRAASRSRLDEKLQALTEVRRAPGSRSSPGWSSSPCCSSVAVSSSCGGTWTATSPRRTGRSR